MKQFSYFYIYDGSYTSATERTRNTNTGAASPSRYTGNKVIIIYKQNP
jgi:hypothetical protein